jgi:aryl-alcohol dehydrogenase-like predicted oxidoreductase
MPHSDSAPRALWDGGPRVSALGFGCYRIDDRIPRHPEALSHALGSGVNLIDTSTNYGDGHSEILVGAVLAEALAAGSLRREDVVIVTKAGYVQGGNQEEAIQRMGEGRPWPEMTEYSPDCWHCISPEFLADQLSYSLERLRLPSVDVLLLHNPEYFLQDAEHRGQARDEARREFYRRIAHAFTHLEKEVVAGRIRAYGISSNTFVVPHDQYDAVSLVRVLEHGGKGLKVIQLPLNPIETGAMQGIHTPDGKSVLDVASGAGLGVLVNRPFNAFGEQGLVRFAPVDWKAPRNWRMFGGESSQAEALEKARVKEMENYLTGRFGDVGAGTVSQKTIRFLLRQKGVTAVLAGMREKQYVDDCVAALR